MRCSDTTLYLSGLQVSILDIISAQADGKSLDPSRLPHLARHSTLHLETRFGSLTVEADPDALHGRRARTGAPESIDPALAALTLANFARHPRRRESRAYARTLAPAALRQASEEDLAVIVATTPGAIGAWRDLAPAQLAVRIMRSGRLADAAVAAGAYPAAAAGAPEGSRTLDENDREAVFARALAAGERPRPNTYMERAALAAAYPDMAAQMLTDPHPLVRVAAYQHAPREALLRALTTEDSDVARRAAAGVLASRLSLPVTPEGPISGRVKGAAERPELLLVDVDGTLIEGEGLRDESSIAALKAAQQAGVVVVLVTGRTLERLAPLDLGIDLAVADGELVDVARMRTLGRFSDKADAARSLSGMLGTTRCAAVGDGAADAPMFAAVREMGGRAGALASGQNEALAEATDLVGPSGSGGVGRYVSGLLAGRQAPQVPPVRVATSHAANYPSYMVSATTFAGLLDRHGVPEGWKAAHGHVTLDYPQQGQDRPLLKPEAGTTLEAYALVRTRSTLSLAVRATLPDGTVIDRQPGGTPLHLTLATAPSERGGHVPPVAAGRAVAAALDADGTDAPTLEMLPEPAPLPALAAPVGSGAGRLPQAVEEAALRAPGADARTAEVAHRGVGEQVAQHLAAERPVESALRGGGRLSSGLVVLTGLPASGKTTLAREAEKLGAVAVSLDGARGEINGDEGSQARLEDVLAISHARMALQLSLGWVVVSDATNVTRPILDHHIRLARAAGVPAVSVALNTAVDVSLARDAKRHEAGLRSVGGQAGGGYSAETAAQVVGKLAARRDAAAAGPGISAGFDASLTQDELLAALRAPGV
jgi:predicted kinase